MLEALVHINAWDDFESIYQIFSHHIILQSHNPTLTQLLNLLEWMIDPLYKQISPCRFIRRPQKSVDFVYESSIPHGQIPQGKSFHDIEFYRNLSRIFKILQSAIGESPIVFVKLCRLFKGYLKTPSPEPEIHTEILNHLQSVMGKFLLPGMTLFKCNPGVVTEFWIAFQEIEYKTRYYYYNEWITNVQFSNPILVEKVVQTLNETNKWLKRLAKDKIKHNGRTLGKLSHNNPVFIFNEIIKSVKSYPNQITSMIGALNYSSNLSLDINLFTVLRHVSDSGKEKLKQNDANLEGWLINLASYTGLFLRKNYNVTIIFFIYFVKNNFMQKVDITGIFVYLCNRLGNNQTLDLILMKEIIAKMSGYDLFENLNEEQLQALAGGPCLQTESASLTSEYRRFLNHLKIILYMIFIIIVYCMYVMLNDFIYFFSLNQIILFFSMVIIVE